MRPINTWKLISLNSNVTSSGVSVSRLPRHDNIRFVCSMDCWHVQHVCPSLGPGELAVPHSYQPLG